MPLVTGQLAILSIRLVVTLLACCLPGGHAWSQEGLIVALGDSNTAGWGVGSASAFPSQLNSMLHQRGYKARIVNAGVNGDTLGGMLGRLDTSVPAGTRLVIVQGGYNDVFQRTPPDVIVGRLQGILSRLHARRVPALLCDSSIRNGMRSAASCRPSMAQPSCPAVPAIRPITAVRTVFICRPRDIAS